MNIVFCSEDRKIILESLLNIPDESIKLLCKTKDQKKQYRICEFFAMTMRSAFKAYFSGEEWEFQTDDKDYRNLLQTKFRYYLEIYNIIWHNWKPIKNYLEEISPSLPEIFRNVPKSPGEMLMAIFEWHILGLLSLVFPEWRTGNYSESFSPRRSYLDNCDFKKLQKKYIEGSIEEEELDDFCLLINKKKQDFDQTYIFNLWLIKCLYVAQKNCKKGDYIDNSLKQLNIINSDLETIKQKIFHPRSKMKGYSINKGIRSRLVRKINS